MDRETKALREMSQMHLAEKKQIFELYIPDSLMKDLFEELAKKDEENLELYQKELEFEKAKKLKAMEEEDQRL